MSSPLRLGIAGAGRVAGLPDAQGRCLAANHARAARALPEVALVAIADRDEQRREKFRRHWELEAFASADEMLARAALDVIVVATPPEAHLAVCVQALEHGVRGILCEKPLTGAGASAREVVERCERAGVPLVVNFMRRWDTSHRELARRIADGELGKLVGAHCAYVGTLRGNGSHALDTLRLFFGGDSRDWQVAWAGGLERGASDGPISAVLSAGSVNLEIAALCDTEYFIFEITLFGSQGRARLLATGNDIRLDFPEDSQAYPGYRYLSRTESLAPDTLPDSFLQALAGLVEAVRTGESPKVPGREHVGTLELVEAVVRRAEARQGLAEMGS
jgi:predicted dehydrogenase